MFINRYKPRHGKERVPLLAPSAESSGPTTPCSPASLSAAAVDVPAPAGDAPAGVVNTGAAEAQPEAAGSFAESKRRSAKASALMGLGTLTSRLLGMVRSPMLMGAVIGLNSLAGNSFDIANKLPTLLYMIIAGGLVNAVLVPAIVKASRAEDAGAAFINKLLTLSMVTLGVITAILTAAAPIVVKIYAATLDPEWYRLTTLFALWCMPQIFFYGMYTIFGQILNARENFGPYMWAPALNNVIAVGGLALMLWIWGPSDVATTSEAATWFSARGNVLAGIHTLGIAAQAGILLIPLRRVGIRYRPDFKWRGSGLGQAGKASLWILAMMGMGMLPTIAQSNVSAGATMRAQQAGMDLDGVVGNLGYSTAYTIYSIPTSVITVSIATALFTKLAQAAVAKNYSLVQEEASYTLRLTSTLMFLSTALVVVLAVPVTRVLSPSSSPAEIGSIAVVVAVMAIGLPGVSAVAVLNRIYYALEDTRAAFLVGLPWQVAGFVGFIACGFLPPQWVVVGVGAVMASTNLAAGVVTYLFVRRRLGGLDLTRVATAHAKLAAITVITVAAGFGLLSIASRSMFASSFGLSVLAIMVASPVLTALFYVLARAFKMPEAAGVTMLLGKLAGRIRR
ncbi:hypothetical protein HMPREF3174_04000 [Trueperella sp. HMSC08H06]|nr:hypothetical protein HMPREF3174_04000 [Trueperella sp. HMSC08H06]